MQLLCKVQNVAVTIKDKVCITVLGSAQPRVAGTSGLNVVASPHMATTMSPCEGYIPFTHSQASSVSGHANPERVLILRMPGESSLSPYVRDQGRTTGPYPIFLRFPPVRFSLPFPRFFKVLSCTLFPTDSLTRPALGLASP